jgi:hypothetical protein
MQLYGGLYLAYGQNVIYTQFKKMLQPFKKKFLFITDLETPRGQRMTVRKQLKSAVYSFLHEIYLDI